MAFSVAAALDAHVAALETPREPDGKWHPSSIFFGCDRRVIYEVRGEPPSDERDAASRRILRIGHELHQFVQTAVYNDESVGEAYTEIDINHPGLDIVGHADQLLHFLNGEWELQEYKTISSWGFKRGGLPKPEHVLQALTYVMVLREVGSEKDNLAPLPDLHRARITYVEKQDLKVSEHVVFLTDDDEAEIRAKIATLESYREGPLPERLPLKDDGKFQWQCNYCPFFTTCWE